MEWGSKSSTWNAMSKLQIEHSMFESSISTSDTFSVDLKLGSLEHMEDVPMETFKNSRALTMASSSHPPSSPLSRRGRPRGAGVQSTVYCSVDGCVSDLSKGREYNRRHKVCERHSKTPVVHIGGAEQRFCQQCSRFHSLVEFDDVKRSCRKRLDGHNRRRRKSQPENLYMNNSCCLQTPYTGSELMQLSTPENWPVISAPAKALYSTEASFDRATELASSECALSLLSSYPTQSSCVCMGPTVPQLAMTSSAQVNRTSLYMDYSLAQFSCSKGLEDGSSAPLSNLSFTNNSHLLDGFHLGQDGFTGNRSSRLFPFSLQ